MTRDYKILTTSLFLSGLLLLLLNDFVFKELYGNWLTGKLSDFAGLFIFPLFWTVLIPKHKTKIFWLTGLLFVYWKSPFSQIFLNAWNDLGLLTISRIVDYSDLIALSMLPIAYFIETNKENFRAIRINPVIPLIIAAFSFLATSYSTDIEIEANYSFNFSKDTLSKRLYYLPAVQNPYRRYQERYLIDTSGQHRMHKHNHDKMSANNDPIEKFIADTMTIFIYEDFCFEGYSATIILSGDAQGSAIKLTGFHHGCARDGKFIIPIKRQDDLEILSESFNEKVIEELRK